jgi:Domain of unknown function (DUF5666)
LYLAFLLVFVFVKSLQEFVKNLSQGNVSMNMKRTFCMLSIIVPAAMVLATLPALAQGQARGGNMPAPGENVVGKVTAVSKDSLTVTQLQGGESVTVKTSETTRVSKERRPFKVEDIKIGETVFARGELKNGVMQATAVAVMNPEMAQRFSNAAARGAGPRGGRMMSGLGPEDMGKKFIIGEVKVINETKLTIARPDGQTQEIEVDENTSFKKDNQSITLPDIKVGEFVHGRGELKGTTFVPKELIVGGRQPRGMGAPNGQMQMQEQKKPDSAPPSVATPPTATPSATPAATPK